MDPRNFLKKVRQGAKKEFSFALEIGYGVVKGAIWAIEEGRTKTFSLSEPMSWEDEGNLLQVADTALAAAIEKAGILEEEEPKKVILGLPYSWVVGEKIIPEKLKLLKKICQGLDLKPVGFVVTAEAIIKYLKVLEGVLPNAILVNVAERELEVVLLRLGKIVGVEIVSRSDNLGEDIAEGLSRIKSEEVLPARIILYDSNKGIEERKEDVLSYPWLRKEKGFNFLHLPKTETVPADFDIKAVALAGGAEVAKSKGIEVEISLGEEKPHEESVERSVEGKAEEEEEVSGRSEEAEGEEKREEEKEPLELSEEAEKKLEFGFVKGQDIASQKVQEEADILPESKENKSPILQVVKPTQLLEGDMRPKSKPPFFIFSKISNLKNRIFRFFSGFGKIFSLFGFAKRLPLVGIIIISLFLILGGALFWFWWFIPKAKITLYVKPQTLEKELKVTLDSTIQESDSQQMIIPAKVISDDVKGEEEEETTGTKTVGEKAAGEVMIYNRTSQEKRLVSGTILTGPGELKFTFNEDVRVASESAGPDYSRIPGKAKVTITAVNIGSEGNLASGTEFAIDKYSSGDLIARNEVALSGGTSREIRVVSKKDQENLVSSLLGKLRTKAVEGLEQKVSSGENLIEQSISEKVLEKNFAAEIGEEKDKFKLILVVNFKALVYQKSDLNSLVNEKIKTIISSGFEFKEEETEVSFKLDKIIDETKVLFTASFKASLWPKFDVEQIRSDLKGKNSSLGESYLAGLSNISGYEVVFVPGYLPSKLKTFPHILKNIEIELRSR